MEEDFDLENPNLSQEVADKVINHQKTLWAISKLEKEIAANPGWDPRDDHWTNWNPDFDNRHMLKELKKEVAGWKEETKDFPL